MYSINVGQGIYGAVCGALLTLLIARARWVSRSYHYRTLAGSYVLRPNRQEKPTGTVVLTHRGGGNFDCVAKNAKQEEEWKAEIQMGTPFKNHGIGTYKHLNNFAGVGNFAVQWLEGEDVMQVAGTSRTYPGVSFAAIWEPVTKED